MSGIRSAAELAGILSAELVGAGLAGWKMSAESFKMSSAESLLSESRLLATISSPAAQDDWFARLWSSYVQWVFVATVVCSHLLKT